jgi:hypothetical protein
MGIKRRRINFKTFKLKSALWSWSRKEPNNFGGSGAATLCSSAPPTPDVQSYKVT